MNPQRSSRPGTLADADYVAAHEAQVAALNKGRMLSKKNRTDYRAASPAFSEYVTVEQPSLFPEPAPVDPVTAALRDACEVTLSALDTGFGSGLPRVHANDVKERICIALARAKAGA